MEEPDLKPEGSKKNDPLSINGEEILNENNIKDRSNSTSNQNNDDNNSNDVKNIDLNQTNNKEDSIFNRFLKEGFDGITTNPNYKLLALLIILLINLSLFLLVGNLGKSFLQNSGLLS